MAYYDEILIGALRLAQADAEQGRLDDARLENIFKTVSDLVEDLAEHGDDDPDPVKRGRGDLRRIARLSSWRVAISESRSFVCPDWAGSTIARPWLSQTYLSAGALMLA